MHAQMPIIRDIVYSATAHGADFQRMCDELGFSSADLNDSDKPVPFKPAAEVWDIAIRQTSDPLIGLHLGEELSPTILGMIGYLMQASKTLHEAIVMLCKYNSLYSTMMKFSFEETKEHLVIDYEPALQWQHQYPESARQSVEIGMSGVLKIFKLLSGKNTYPIRVDLAYPVRARDEYERIFRSAIYFNAKKNSLSFHKEHLRVPVVSHDKSLFQFFTETLEQKLRLAEKSEQFSNQLRQAIITDFKGRVPSVEIVASHFNLTPRSLQRKLKEENVSYRKIEADIKKELAQAILDQPQFRIGEVAEILGYADASAFRKAYKKWMSG